MDSMHLLQKVVKPEVQVSNQSIQDEEEDIVSTHKQTNMEEASNDPGFTNTASPRRGVMMEERSPVNLSTR